MPQAPQAPVMENLNEEEIYLLTALGLGQKVEGGFKFHAFENIQELKDKIEPLEQPIRDFVNQVILEKRKFPPIFEGEETAALRDLLRKRKILTASDLLINDGQGHIETDRIQNKLQGVSSQENEMILSHFNNEPEPFGLRHEHGNHWSYLKLAEDGQYLARRTLGDGNCAFNGFALGFCDLVLSNKIVATHPIFSRLQEKLSLDSPDRESFQAWIAAHSSESLQENLQGILREIAINYIELHYDAIYRDGYEQQVYDAYCDLEDDTFRPHPHITRQFKERDLSPIFLAEWWQAEGKAIYFANMRHHSWAWGGESEINALARYFGLTVFWEKGGGSRTIGGIIIEDLTEEQIKRWTDLDIGERVGNGFQLHRFERIEDLQEKIQPISPSERWNIERILEDKKQKCLDFPPTIPGEYSLDPILQLKRRGVLNDGNRLPADEQGNLATDQLKKRMNGIQNPLLRNQLIEVFNQSSALFIQRAIHPPLSMPVQENPPGIGSYIREEKESIVNASGLNVLGQSLDVAAGHVWMPGAQVNVEDHIHVAAEKEANLPQASFTSGELWVESSLLQAEGIHAKVQGPIALQGAHLVNLNEADLKTPLDTQIEGDYLLLKKSKIESRSIQEKGLIGIAAEQSIHKAETVLAQISEGTIHLEKSSAEAGQQIIQEADVWIDHTEAINKAPLNTIRTTFLDNPRGNFKGNLDGVVKTFDNEGGHLNLGDGMSSLDVESMASSYASKIVGEGGIQILSRGEFHEKGEVKLGDSYQVHVQKSDLVIDNDVLAKNVHLQASDGNVGISEGVKVLIKEQGILDGNQVDNRGFVESAESLEIIQKNYQDPGAARGEKHLKLYSVSSIDLRQPMQTAGDLSIVSEKMVNIHAALDVENDLFLQGTGVNLWERVDVSGKGIFHSEGNVELNHIRAIFRKGIALQAKRFVIHTSDVDIMGNSAIKVEEFLLRCNVSVPHHWYRNTPHAYPHIPSNFRLIGDLYLNASVRAVNDASNLLIKGNMFAFGKELENNIRMHLYQYCVPVGTYHTGWIRRRKETCYESRSIIVIDGWANSQISETLQLELESLRNTGILVAYDIRGRISRLYNGIFTNRGRTPIFVRPLPTVEGFAIPPVKAGGYFGSGHDFRLTTDLTHCNGYLEAQNIFSLWTKDLFLTKRVIHETVEAAKKGSMGRKSKDTLEIDLVQPGAEINGKETYLHADRAVDQGLVAGDDIAYIEGGDFTLDAVPVRSVVPLQPGRVAPWKSARTATVKTDFEGGKVYSKKVRFNLGGTLTNNGSDIVSLKKLGIVIGSFRQKTLSSSYPSTVKKGLTSDKKLHTIIIKEPSTQCLDGRASIETTKADIIWQGLLASLNGPLILDSARDIYAQSNTLSVNNKKTKASVAFVSANIRKSDSNTTRTSLPSLIAGKGAFIRANNHLGTEGLQAKIIGKAAVYAKSSHDHGHVVPHYQRVKGGSVGVSAFGFSAIQSIIEGGGIRDFGKALLSEDPALENYLSLARSKDIAGIFTNSILAIKNTWSEAAKFSQAFNKGNLGNSLAQHFGLTDKLGNFKPAVTIKCGFSKKNTQWTHTFFSNISIINGSLEWNVSTQRYTGSVIYVDEDATFTGDNITGEAGIDIFKEKGSGGNLSLTFGGPSGFDVGVDGSLSRSKGKQHTPWRVNAGKVLLFNVANRLSLPGAQLEGEEVHIKAPVLDGVSLQDTFSQKALSGGASLSGQVSFSYQNEQSAQVKQPTWIKARKTGSIDATSIFLIGVLTENMILNARHFRFEDVHDFRKGRGFSASLMTRPILNRPKDEGFTDLGKVDAHWNKQKGLTRTTVLGGNGASLGGVNTSAVSFQEKGKEKKSHFGAPLIDWNEDALAAEAQEIDKAFNFNQAQKPVVKEPAIKENRFDEEPVEIVEEFDQQQEASLKEEEKPSASDIEALQAIINDISKVILQESLKGNHPPEEANLSEAEKQLTLYHRILSDQKDGDGVSERRVPTIKELRDKNPLFDVMHSSVNQSMALAGWSVLAIRVIRSIESLNKEMIKEKVNELRSALHALSWVNQKVTKVLSRVNPALAQRCIHAELLYKQKMDDLNHAVRTFPKQKLKELGLWMGLGQNGFLDNAIRNHKISKERFSLHLEMHLGIPKEQGEKYYDDATTVQIELLTRSTPKLLSKPLKALIRGSTKAISKGHNLYRKVNPKIYTKEEFSKLNLGDLKIVNSPVRSKARTVYQIGGPQKLITSGKKPPVPVVIKNSVPNLRPKPKPKRKNENIHTRVHQAQAEATPKRGTPKRISPLFPKAIEHQPVKSLLPNIPVAQVCATNVGETIERVVKPILKQNDARISNVCSARIHHDVFTEKVGKKNLPKFVKFPKSI